jgi:ABC-type sulfate transport system permease component
MLTIYQAITLLLAVLVAWVTVRERSLGRQITGGIVLILLLLRIFLIK